MHSYITLPTDIPAELREEAASISLPSNEVLQIGLELFCRHFHTLQPFLHLPTFSPNEAPVATLLSMCLIGFHILNTRGTNPLLAQVLVVRQSVYSKPADPTANVFQITLNKTRVNICRISDAQPISAINELMNAFLVLSLGAMTGVSIRRVQRSEEPPTADHGQDYAVQPEYRQLYKDTIHVCFSASYSTNRASQGLDSAAAPAFLLPVHVFSRTEIAQQHRGTRTELGGLG